MNKPVEKIKAIADTAYQHIFKVVFVLIFALSLLIFPSFWKTCIDGYLIPFLNKFWVIPIMSKLNGYEGLLFLVYVLVLLLVYYKYAIEIAKKIDIKFQKRISFLTIFTVVIVVSYLSDRWFYSYIGNSRIPWAVGILTPWLGELYLYTRRKTISTTETDLELEKTENVEDSYQRATLVTTAYESLQTCFSDEKSFCVAITGSWGSGKSTFLNALKMQMNEGQEIDAVLDFEPWRNDSPQSLTKAFFNALGNVLAKDNHRIYSYITEYVSFLIDEDSPKSLRALAKGIKDFISYQHEKDTAYSHIQHFLKTSQRKIVICIDDIDRLQADEIKEVLKLIRNTASFPYLQFIVAFDKEYILETLRQSGISNPLLYLEKFFNVEIALPSCEDHIICEQLKKRIEKDIKQHWNTPNLDESIQKMLTVCKSDRSTLLRDAYLVSSLLPTMRNVIQFSNEFHLTVNFIAKNGTVIDLSFQSLFFVELLRYRYSNVYNILRNDPFLLISKNNQKFYQSKKISFNDDNSFFLEHYTTSDITLLNELMSRLFNYEHNDKSISNPQNMSKYFIFHTDEKILTEVEYMSLAHLDSAMFQEEVERLYHEKYEAEFVRVSLNILRKVPQVMTEYQDFYDILLSLNLERSLSKEMEEISDALFHHIQESRIVNTSHLIALLRLLDVVKLDNQNPYIEKVEKLLDDIFTLSNLRSRMIDEFDANEKTKVQEVLEKTKHPLLISNGLRNFLDTKYKTREEDMSMFNREEFSNIILNIFLTYEHKLTKDGFALLKNCIDHTDRQNQKIIFMKAALEAMKKAIDADPQPYLSDFVQTGRTSNGTVQIIEPEPVYEQIFGSTENFSHFLEKQQGKVDTEILDRVNNFWKLYENNGYESLRYGSDKDVQQIVCKNFKDEIKQLNALLELKKQLQENTISKQDALEKLSSIKLFSKLHSEVQRMIDQLS